MAVHDGPADLVEVIDEAGRQGLTLGR